MDEPSWFQVVGGPPPPEVVFRDTLLCLAGPLGLIVLSLWLPPTPRLLLTVMAVGLGAALSLLARRRWWRQQAVRVLGNVLEHHDGDRVVRVSLNRAVVSSAVAPPAGDVRAPVLPHQHQHARRRHRGRHHRPHARHAHHPIPRLAVEHVAEHGLGRLAPPHPPRAASARRDCW